MKKAAPPPTPEKLAGMTPPPAYETDRRFVMTDATRLRITALDMVIRACGVVAGWKPQNAAELTKEALELEKWLKQADEKPKTE